MATRPKKSADLGTLTALASLGALTATQKRELDRRRRSASARERTAASVYQELPAVLAAGAPAHAVPTQLKSKILAAIGEPPKSKLAVARNVGSFLSASDTSAWRDHAVKGVRYRVLSVNSTANYAVTLYELAPGAVFPEHKHAGGAEECYVLTGDFHVDGRELHAGDFHHALAGTEHGESITENGCTLLVIAPAADYGT